VTWTDVGHTSVS